MNGTPVTASMSNFGDLAAASSGTHDEEEAEYPHPDERHCGALARPAPDGERWSASTTT